jgi:hypothetical protein
MRYFITTRQLIITIMRQNSVHFYGKLLLLILHPFHPPASNLAYHTPHFQKKLLLTFFFPSLLNLNRIPTNVLQSKFTQVLKFYSQSTMQLLHYPNANDKSTLPKFLNQSAAWVTDLYREGRDVLLHVGLDHHQDVVILRWWLRQCGRRWLLKGQRSHNRWRL